MAVSDYNTNPDLNTQISGINIAEGCPPSGINNAIRQLMADVKGKSTEQDAAIAACVTSADLGAADITATGSTASRSLANRFADVVNVKDFGAVGDGVTDDTAAIQAALAAVETITNPDNITLLKTPIFFPHGTYLVKDNSILTKINSFCGNGSKLHIETSSQNETLWIGYAMRGTLYIDNDDKISAGIPKVTEKGLMNIGNGQLVFWPDLDGDGDYDADMYADGNMYLSARSGIHFIVGKDIKDIASKSKGRIILRVVDPATSSVDDENFDNDEHEDNDDVTQYTAPTVYFQTGLRFSGDDPDSDSGYANGSVRNLAFSRNRKKRSLLYLDFTRHYCGIGTINPETRLHVRGSSKNMAHVMMIESAQNDSAYITFKGKNTTLTDSNAARIGVDTDIMEISAGAAGLKFIGSSGTIIPKTKNAQLGSSSYSFGTVRGNDFRANVSIAPSAASAATCGTEALPWSTIYAATSSIDTSDAREKQQITTYTDDVLDAWSEVEFRQFIFNDAFEKKGDAARLHSGVIAQQVMEAFAAHGLDATRYALLCYDAWEDEYEDEEVIDVEATYDDDGNELTPQQSHIEHKLVTPAGNRYGIRYSEALCLEAAYQRRRAERLEARVAALEEKVNG